MITKYSPSVEPGSKLSMPDQETEDGFEIAEVIESVAYLLRTDRFQSAEMTRLSLGSPDEGRTTVIELVIHHLTEGKWNNND